MKGRALILFAGVLLSSSIAEARQARHNVGDTEGDILARYTKCKERGIPFKVEDKDLFFCWDENADALWDILDRRRRKGDVTVDAKGDNARGRSLSLGNQICFKWPDQGGYRACVVNPNPAP
jgi:hypothetical protein